ncbi:MAG: ABC transporter permease [Oscillospiraceae bacterium]|jgi:oligopeptide transport system permease protein|nr:ABC transporter permease [Oscillospiraceae bacterium]
MGFLKYALRKLGLMVVTLAIIASATFFLVNAVPGNPIAARTLRMPETVKAELYAKYGFDKPLWPRYVITMRGLLRGDFGMSAVYEGDTVPNIIASKLPVSARLGLQQMLVGVTLGILLGVVSALKNGRAADFAIIALAAFAVSIPQLVFSLLLQKFFAGAKTGLPIIGWSGFKSTILPTIAGAFVYTSFYARLMKSSILDVIGQEYIMTAESKGISGFRVVTRHVLRNAFVPIITYLPMTVAMCVTGSFFVESVFTIPGLGYYYVKSVQQRDLSMVMGLTVFIAALLLAVVFVTDILYKLVDPRIRLERAGKR